MIWLVAVLVVLAGITVFFLRGPDLGEFDSPASFTPVDAGGVAAEWVQAPGASASRRVLYIHGGAR